MEYTGAMLYWMIGLFVGFLPFELYAAVATPTKSDTFSEYIWWVFGVRPRADGRPIKWGRARRFILAGMCVSLTAHFVFAATVVPVIIFGTGAGATMLYAFIKER
jgi:hypothetical protein